VFSKDLVATCMLILFFIMFIKCEHILSFLGIYFKIKFLTND